MDIHDLSEKIEQVSLDYSEKFQVERDDDWFVLKLQEELGELIQSYLMMKGKARQKGKTKEAIREEFENEVADVLAHVLLLAKRFDVDLDKVIASQWLKWTNHDK